jgi:hypothetical protein
MPHPHDSSDSNGIAGFLDPQSLLRGEDPATYFSFQNQFGQAPTQRRFFQGQFQNIFNQFLGGLGQQIQQGESPTNTFSDFMENYNFGQQFGQLPPSVRGATTSRFAPSARFLNF